MHIVDPEAFNATALLFMQSGTWSTHSGASPLAWKRERSIPKPYAMKRVPLSNSARTELLNPQ